MKVRVLILGIAMIAALGSSACGKDDKDQSATSSAKGSATASAEAVPTADEVAALDCDTICQVQWECYQKGGMNLVEADVKKACMGGCEMITHPDVYKPDVHGKTAAALVSYQKGSCE